MEITEIQVDGYERVARCRDEESGLHALIAVHNTALGPSLGGMRMLPYKSEDEALFDVLRLAKGMTYKSAVAETGLGGGKSVIIGDPKTLKSPALFHVMGKFVNHFGGTYITAEDMNIGIPDLSLVHETTKHVVGLSRDEGSSGNPSPYTAYGVVQGLRAVMEECFGSDSFAGKRILIQGVGAVGGRMAELLNEKGAHVMICDINQERVDQLVESHGYEPVTHEGHFSQECDVYAPCARGAGINDDTIPQLKCKAVAGCANNVLLEPRHADDLKARGILYAPDYVLNAGGIINVACELLEGGYQEAYSLSRIDRIYNNLKQVFSISKEQGISTRDAAAHLAEERLAGAGQA